jgi:nitroimidazol reductase NimA-like FMN-containing flavoprotein (pyridoxamine 5'-phosphate oxidase superfamily)
VRRKVFESRDAALFQDILARAQIGELGLVDEDGYPRIVPVNFAYVQGAIYFHGALAGEKFDLLKKNPKATFLAYQAFSPIPSTVLSRDGSACPATIFYRSAYAKGRGQLVEEKAEKALALQRLMEKDQPEGGYLDFLQNLDFYESALKSVGIFKVSVESFSVKDKFAQNKTPEQKAELVAFLERRGSPIDLETARIIREDR